MFVMGILLENNAKFNQFFFAWLKKIEIVYGKANG
jgi:hypothetical protein